MTIRIGILSFTICYSLLVATTASAKETAVDITREMDTAKQELHQATSPTWSPSVAEPRVGRQTVNSLHSKSYFTLSPPQVDRHPFKGSISAGMVYIPFQSKDMSDIHVSDWQNYGTGAMEGRASLPLSRANKRGVFPGVTLALEGPRDIPVFLEYQGLAFSTFSFQQFLLGSRLQLFDTPWLDFHVVPKMGYALLNLNFGKVEMLPGKLQPVITPEGTFFTGNKLAAEISGFIFQANLEASLHFTQNFGLTCGYGYNFAFMSDLVIKAGDIKLNYSSPTLVKPVLDTGSGQSSTVQAGVRPRVDSSGSLLFMKFFYEY